jgi:Protein phosphatase 2C
MSRARAAAAGAPFRPEGSRSIEGRAALRLVHSAHQPQRANLSRAAPASIERADKRVSEQGGGCAEAASAGCHSQRLDHHRKGNSWAWAGSRADGTSHSGAGLTCQEVFDCRTWQRGNAQPVLIAAMAGGAGSAARAGLGAALAVSALVNILDEEMTEDFETGRLAKLLRGTVGEVQLMLDRASGRT